MTTSQTIIRFLTVTLMIALVASDVHAIFSDESSFIQGGFENIVVTGSARMMEENGASESVHYVLAGGNHGSGDLGETFLWPAEYRNNLVGAGFNDMQLAIIKKDGTHLLYSYRHVFQKPLGTQISKALMIKWRALPLVMRNNNSINYIRQISMDQSGWQQIDSRTGSANGTYKIAFNLNVKTDLPVTRVHDYAKPEEAELDNIKRMFFSPGIKLIEYPFSNQTGKDQSQILISGPNSKFNIVIDSMLGTLEKSEILIAVPRNFIAYDHIVLLPVNSENCAIVSDGIHDGKGLVAYVDKIMDRGFFAPEKILRYLGFDGFFIHGEIDRGLYDKEVELAQNIRSIDKIEALPGLDLQRGATKIYHGHPAPIKLGVGQLYRNIIEVHQANSANECSIYGLLDYQLPQENPRKVEEIKP